MQSITIEGKTLHLKADMVEKLHKGEVALRNENYPYNSKIMDFIMGNAFSDANEGERWVFGYYYGVGRKGNYTATDYNPCRPIVNASDFFTTHPEEIADSTDGYKEAFERLYAAGMEGYKDLQFHHWHNTKSGNELWAALESATPFINNSK